jgi:hypothetical protein
MFSFSRFLGSLTHDPSTAFFHQFINTATPESLGEESSRELLKYNPFFYNTLK